MFVYRAIASANNARMNCIANGNAEWKVRHTQKIEQLVREYLPSGSGYDNDTKIDFDCSSNDELIFRTSFHHMDENGYYCGWSNHKVIVRPSFDGIRIDIKSEYPDDIEETMNVDGNEFMYDDFYHSLLRTVKEV